MPRDKSTFRFKQFTVRHIQSTMKVGTDSVLLGSWTAQDIQPKRMMDVGTGSGILALMMAQRFPEAEIVGVDIHAPSIEDFQWNIDQFPLPHQLKAQHQDFLEFSLESKIDFIISNPPYFSEALLSDSDDKNRVRHQIHLTMEKLVQHAKNLLSENGILSLILPTKEMLETIEIAREHSLYPQRICNISSSADQKPIRMMVEFSGVASFSPEEDLLIIYEADRSYTEDYKRLTRDFYLNF